MRSRTSSRPGTRTPRRSPGPRDWSAPARAGADGGPAAVQFLSPGPSQVLLGAQHGADVEDQRRDQHHHHDQGDRGGPAEVAGGDADLVGVDGQGGGLAVGAALVDQPDLGEDLEIPDDRQEPRDHEQRFEDGQDEGAEGPPGPGAVDADRLEQLTRDRGEARVQGEGYERDALADDDGDDDREGGQAAVEPRVTAELAEAE